ncbi:MAG: EAL domain-containing protein [Candidatus Thiodiazotropha sp.]
MSSDTSKTNLLSSFLHQVPGRVSAILENWHQLVHSDWKGDLLDTLIERISTLAESGRKFNVPQITQSGTSLIGHLSDYHGTGLKPQHDDVVALDGLVHAFKDASIQACNQQVEALASRSEESVSTDKKVVSGGHKVFLLGIDDSLAAGLQLHRDILVVYHLHSGDILFHPVGLELILLPVGQEVVDDLKTRLAAMRVKASGFWAKPVDPYLVAKHIEKLSSSDSHTKHRVLIVEDDPAQADFANAILSKSNFECLCVTDPLLVLDALNDFAPDLILMDLYMPGASGTELTTVIREQSEYIDIPIVFLSGEQDVDKQLTALSFGGEDFLSKPIAPKHLISTVSNRIYRAHQLKRRMQGYAQNEQETGLHSRNYLLERLDALLLGESTMDEVTGVFFLQIDNPENLIESVGIGGLDAVQALAAKHLKEKLLSQDILTRFGDSSLSLLALRKTSEELIALGEKLCQSITQQIFEVDSTTVGVTLSIGIYPVEPGNQDSRSIIAHAQIASRQAVEAGGNQVHAFKPIKSEASEKNTAKDMESLIQKALDEDYFDIFFQPVVALQGSTVAHYQTLLRLQEPNGSLHAAADFIPTAEKIGLISKVDHWTTRRAITVVNEHRKKGTHLHLFVSQSADLLENMERLTWLRKKYQSGHIGKHALTFEFNIHEIAKKLNSAKICFDVLNKIGITCLLTRVTNTPEAERVIRHLSVSYIKLDYSLLSDSGEELQQLIEMVHELDIKVIAPQVEDPRSIAVLWASGADFVQGNFVQRPENNLIYDFNESVL